ncbi:MAG: uroporphyrinogen decarboxylase [Alphaproteobacteria bacterium]
MTKPILDVLAGNRLDPPPLWMMRQAGRYLKEYLAVRAEAGSFLELCYDSDKAAEVTLQPIRFFEMDAAILFADILLVPQAMGGKLWFAEGEGPRFEPVTTAQAIEGLSAGDPDGVLKPVYETVSKVKAGLPQETALIGFAGAPWTVATYLVAGRGTPDQAPARKLAHDDPALMDLLIDKIVGATIPYLKNQIAAGAEVIQLFDSWASYLAPRDFERLVIRPTLKIVKALKADYPETPIIGFPRGAGTAIGAYARETGVDAIGLDTGVDPQGVNALLPKGLPVQGALDPLALRAGGAALEDGVKACLQGFAERPHIFNLGHGIVLDTPREHVARAVALVRQGV